MQEKLADNDNPERQLEIIRCYWDSERTMWLSHRIIEPLVALNAYQNLDALMDSALDMGLL